MHCAKYHLNGKITCKAFSEDQNCYVRVTTDAWKTFQETQAICVYNYFNENDQHVYQKHKFGNDSPEQVGRSHKKLGDKIIEFQFDFLMPLPREDLMAENPNELVNRSRRLSISSEHGDREDQRDGDHENSSRPSTSSTGRSRVESAVLTSNSMISCASSAATTGWV